MQRRDFFFIKGFVAHIQGNVKKKLINFVLYHVAAVFERGLSTF
jgi:hypothetical protein